MQDTYYIKQFAPVDWAGFRVIRLEALLTEPGMFCASYDEQSRYPDEHWENRLRDNNFAYFGLYDGDELIGLTGIARNVHEPDEAELIASYIKQQHRRKGLSGLFYAARIEWARAQGLERLIVSHRESNISSMKANQKFGFSFTHSVLRHWHDKKWENNVYYELVL